MKAVVLHEYGGPEKLRFEDNVQAQEPCKLSPNNRHAY
jgi:hypothetical protein